MDVTQQRVSDIMDDYARQRDQNAMALKERKQVLYEKYPELAEIDLQMSQIGAEISKSILKKPQNIEIMLMELKASLEQLKKRRAMILINNKISPNALELTYKCDKCKDTGFTENNKRCSCFTQKLIQRAYGMSNIEKQLSVQNFEHFDLTVFSLEKGAKDAISQRDNMKQILSEAESFVQDFPNSQNLFFYGASGLGKTYLCNCIAKSLLDSGHSVIYQTPFSIINIIEKKTFTDKSNTFVQMAYAQLTEADLLIIDDLGTETPNSFTISEFYNIINSRILANKSTIISTNIKLSEISSFYNDRIDSRIKGHYKLLKFFGPDIRWEV